MDIHKKKHGIDATVDHDGVSGATEDNFLSFDENGLPQDSGENSSSFDAAGSAATAESNANSYTDGEVANYLPLAGGTMAGDIDMGGNDISIPDDTADALQIKEGANEIIGIDTTDDSELITLGYDVNVDGDVSAQRVIVGKLTEDEVLELYRNNDSGGTVALTFYTKNAAGEYTRAGYIGAKLNTLTDGSEDGGLAFYTIKNGSPANLALEYDASIYTWTFTNKAVNIGNVDGGNYLAVDENGIITAHGDARWDGTLWSDVTAFKAPGTKPAELIDYGIADAWEFTDGTDDTIVSRFKIPHDMDRSVAPTFLIGWSTPTASAGNCRWQIEYLYRSENEAMDAAADETLVDNFAASGTAKGLVVSTLSPTNPPSATDICVSMRVKRRADEVADTLGEDCQLYGVCMVYTKNKLGTAV